MRRTVARGAASSTATTATTASCRSTSSASSIRCAPCCGRATPVPPPAPSKHSAASSPGSAASALVSLAEAREKALANRKLAREGGDPLAEKRRMQGVPSFVVTSLPRTVSARIVYERVYCPRATWRTPSRSSSSICSPTAPPPPASPPTSSGSSSPPCAALSAAPAWLAPRLARSASSPARVYGLRAEGQGGHGLRTSPLRRLRPGPRPMAGIEPSARRAGPPRNTPFTAPDLSGQ